MAETAEPLQAWHEHEMQALELKKEVFSEEGPWTGRKVHEDPQPGVNGGMFAVPGAETDPGASSQ